MKSLSGLRTALLCAASLQGLSLAYAQEAPGSEPTTTKSGAIETVTVTAQKRREDIMKAAASISVISGTTIANQGLTTADDVLKNVPDVSTTQIGFGSTISIRGLGWDLPTTVGEGAVSTTFDGSFSNDVAATLFGYYDLNRVEVLRGPQGTLYGRNSTAGAVNVVTADPNFRGVNGYALYEIGNYSEMREEGALNVPITDTLAARIAFSNINRNGYMSTGQEDQVGTGVRGKLLYKPNNIFSLLLIGDRNVLGGRGDDGNVTVANYNAGHPFLSTETSPLQSQRYRSFKLSADAELTAGPGQFTLIPDWEKGVNSSIGYNANAGVLSETPSSDEQKSVELRYASLPSSPLKWTSGIYYYTRTELQGPSTPGPCAELCNYGAQTKAIFGQATYPILPTFRIVGGLRYSDDLVTEKSPSTPQLANARANFDILNWKAGLEYDVTPNVLSYLTIASGSRPGGFNDPSSASDFGFTFQPEHVIDYEIGAKAKMLDDRLQFTGSLFYYNYTNYQAVDAYLNGAVFFVRFFNVRKAEDYGAELEAVYQVTPDTRLDISTDFLHARYTSTFEEHLTPTGPATNLDGLELDHSPAVSLHGSIDHTFYLPDGSELDPSVSARWFDHQLVSPFPSAGADAPAYAVLDLNLRYQFANGKWSLNGFMKNVTNTIYKASGNSSSIQAGAPRMYGLNVQYRF